MKRKFSVLSNGRFKGFKYHPNLEGTHALLSASNYHWVHDSEEKFIERLETVNAARKGTRLHAFAEEAILLKRRQPEEGQPGHDILCAYINDALDLGLRPETVLQYSIYTFGTADAIGFEEYFNHEHLAGFLRIHDYKSGKTEVKNPEQLYMYAVYFCFEYGFMPFEIEGELRIYQGDKIRSYQIDRQHLAYLYDRTRIRNALAEERGLGGLI
jgi:hypothetical protein